MTTNVKSCGIDDNLQRAAQIMWENDCGAVPVVDGDGRVVGMVTDRDICMSAYTRGLALWQIPVSSAMANQVHGVREEDPLEAVEALMRRARIRRVPVLDAEARLRGILSLNARSASRVRPLAPLKPRSTAAQLKPLFEEIACRGPLWSSWSGEAPGLHNIH
jgi:CBS-domain-containing membrane protein